MESETENRPGWYGCVNNGPTPIDLQGWPWLCVGFEFEGPSLFGSETYTITELDVDFNTGTAENEFREIHLVRENGVWCYRHLIIDKESKKRHGELLPGLEQ